MTVTAEKVQWVYDGDGSAGPFAYTQRIENKSWLKVWVGGTLQTVDVHYTVSNVGVDGGGNVSFTGGNEPAAGTGNVTIELDPPLTQQTAYTAFGTFPALSHGLALDKLTLSMQYLDLRVDRALRLPEGDPAASIGALPALADRKSKVLRFDADGDPAAGELTAEWIAKAGAPSDAEDGNDGDMYLDTTTDEVYGPKTGGAWGAAVADLTGAQGPAGADGADGADGSGLFDGSEPNVTPTSSDRFAVLDASDADNPKYVLGSALLSWLNTALTVATAGLADLAVTTAKLAAGAVTVAKLANAARAYDIGFTAGYGADGAEEAVAVQEYGWVVLPRAMTFEDIEAHAETAPTGAAMRFDVKKNGTTIFSTAPEIDAGTNADDGNHALSTTAGAAGDRLSFEVTQIGSSTAGSGVMFTLKGRLA